MLKVIIWIICIIYLVVPTDLFPGPVDDAIVLFVVAGFSALTANKDSK